MLVTTNNEVLLKHLTTIYVLSSRARDIRRGCQTLSITAVIEGVTVDHDGIPSTWSSLYYSNGSSPCVFVPLPLPLLPLLPLLTLDFFEVTGTQGSASSAAPTSSAVAPLAILLLLPLALPFTLLLFPFPLLPLPSHRVGEDDAAGDDVTPSAGVGTAVGRVVRSTTGLADGNSVGAMLGTLVGLEVGLSLTGPVGSPVGAYVGPVGKEVGLYVGASCALRATADRRVTRAARLR